MGGCDDASDAATSRGGLQKERQPEVSQGSLSTLVRAENGGARLPLAARVLWQRDPKAVREWAGKPVLAFMLNGAQGDDDEAHGGHFAIVTGIFGQRGEWGDWLVNNFYNLDSVSENGIIASTLPIDAYMADINSSRQPCTAFSTAMTRTCGTMPRRGELASKLGV